MRIDLERVTFRNFLSFGNKPTEWNISPGVHLITGINRSTGSRNACGKTSLSSSILFALFGKTDKNITNAEIINWKNRKGCEVSLDFRKGEEQFRIERGLKPSFLKLYHNGKEVPQPSSKVSFQEDIENDILGFDYTSFISLMQCNPNNSLSLFKASKATKRKFIEQLFGLESFSQFSDLCREKISECNIEISQSKSENTAKLTQIESLKSFISSLKELLKTGDEDKRDYRTAKEKLLSLDKSQLMTNISLLNLEGTKYQYRSEKCATKFAQYEFEEKSLEKIINSIGDFDDDLYEKYEKDIEKIALIQGEIDLVNEKGQDLTDELKLIDSKRDFYNDKCLTLATQLKEIEKQMKSLLSDELCPTCGQKVDISKFKKESEVKEKLQLELAKEKKKKIEVEVKYGKVEGKVVELTEEKQSLINELNILKKNQLKFVEMKNDKEKQNEKKAAIERQKRIKKYILILNKRVQNFSEKMLEISEKLTKANKELENYNILKNAKKILREKIQLHKENEEKTLEKIQNAEAEIAGFEKTIQTNIQNQNEQERMKQYFEYFRELCKDENIKQYAISAFVPFLNQRLNHYLSESYQPFYMKLDNWLDLEIKGPGISENSSYGSLSGGESKIVDLSMQMAFLDIAKIQASTFPNVLVLDELLDTSVDSVNLQKLLNIIKLKQKEDNLGVYIISHRSEIASLDATSTINVIKENGYSRIEQ